MVVFLVVWFIIYLAVGMLCCAIVDIGEGTFKSLLVAIFVAVIFATISVQLFDALGII